MRATTTFLLLLLQGLVQYPQRAGHGLDEATRERMQQRAEYLTQQMARLLQELEQNNLQQKNVQQKYLEQSAGAWGALLVWQFWAILGILVLLLVLCFGLRKMRRHPDNSGQKESSSSSLEEDKEGDNTVVHKEIESNQSNVERDNKDGNEAGGSVDAKEERSAGNEAREGEEDVKVDLDRGCSMIRELMDELIHVFEQGLSSSFYPVPREAIGVGSAFEGWSPCAEDAVYQVLVPLSPPPGHAFHLEELDTAGMPQRNFCVRVELECTCRREQLGQDILCFLHHPEEVLRRRQEPSLLHTLCTGTCLDVEKTAHWFCRFVRVAWLLLPQSRHGRLMLLPSSRSCKFQLSQAKESFTAELILGVQRGDSDVFVGSQPAEAGTPSTVWLETYAVAEAKFFRHICRRAPPDSWHCKCLQLLSPLLLGVGFSSYTLKTVVMHLLSTLPPARWSRGDFEQRLVDILKFLHCSLQTAQLNHFVVGNARFPLEISLPSELRVAEPPNLFQHLVGNLDAHLKAVHAYLRLLHRLRQLLLHSH